MRSEQNLPRHWTTRPLRDCVYFQEGPGLRNWQYRDVGVPFVNIRCLKDGLLLREEMTCLDPAEVEAKYQHFLLDAGDYVVSSSGTLGRLAEVQASDLPCMLNTSVIRFRPLPNGGIDRRFLRYYLLSDHFTSQILAHANGSAQLNYGPSHLKQMSIVVPPLKEQIEIGTLLGLLDDRIDLLRQTNATLEAIAQALFKGWFIDFDPVRAKQAGREPEGMDAATAALFPAEFEESAQGLMPKGWSTRRIEQLARKVAMGPFGSNIKVSTFVDQGIPVISGQHLRETLLEDRTFNFITEQHATKLSGSQVGSGDIVFTHAGNIGQVSLIPAGAKYQTYVLSQRQFYLRCDVDAVSPEYLTYFFRSPGGQHVLLANASQVGVPSIARPASYLKSIEVTVPTVEISKAFAQAVGAIHQSILNSRGHINTLLEIRDTLLPRLISGKLRLPEVQEQLEDALA